MQTDYTPLSVTRSRGLPIPPPHPPCLGRSPSWLANHVPIWATTNHATVESSTQNPTDWLLSSLCYERKSFPCHFFSFHLHHPPPPFLTHFHFFQFFILIPLLTHPFLISRAILNGCLFTRCNSLRAHLEKITIFSVPPVAKSHRESCFWLNWQKHLIEIVGLTQSLLTCHSILLISTDLQDASFDQRSLPGHHIVSIFTVSVKLG